MATRKEIEKTTRERVLEQLDTMQVLARQLDGFGIGNLTRKQDNYRKKIIGIANDLENDVNRGYVLIQAGNITEAELAR